MNTGGAGRGGKPGGCRGFQTPAMREIVAPLVPEAGVAESEAAVGLDPDMTLVRDFLLPDFRRGGGFGGFGVFQQFRKDIQIVDFTEEVLKPLQIFAPGGIMFRQQTFESVAKSF